MTFELVLRAILRYWGTVIGVLILAIGAAFAYLTTAQPVYAATSQAIVMIAGKGSNSDLLQGSSFVQQRIKSYVDIVTSPLILDPVIDDKNLTMSADSLAANVQAASPLNTVLVNITVKSTNPEQAAELANAVTRSFARVVPTLEATQDGESSPVSVRQTRPATVPAGAVEPKPLLVLAAATVLGLLLATGVAVARTLLDTRIRGPKEVRYETDVPIIGQVPEDKGLLAGQIPVRDTPMAPISEEFRQIRTNLGFVSGHDHDPVFVVSSAIASEGKTTIVTNLALAFAQSGKKVALIDADLRRPRLAEATGIEGAAGLTTALIGEAAIQDLLQPWGESGVWLLPSGQIPPNPSEMLGSSAMTEVIDLIKSRFDVVLIDAPPLLPVTDASVLASSLGRLILVVSCVSERRQQLRSALEKLDAVQAKPAGLVLNRTVRKKRDGYGYYKKDGTPEAPRVLVNS